MDEWTEIRRKVLVDGASKRSVLRDYGIGHQALTRILANPEPPGYQMAEVRKKPVLGPHLATIDAILAEDKEAPPKQRHTARRIFERLRDEHGYSGCYSQVQTAVKRAKASSREAFVPLSHPPGHAQFDFGEATVEIAGVRTKAALGVITLPYSDTYFVVAYPRECSETFQAAHVAGFEFFGAVPLRTSYDNTTIAVTKVMGTERELTRAFLTLESHYLFDHHFCRVGRGNEKGHVENHVGYSRRNLLARDLRLLRPSFGQQGARCRAHALRVHRQEGEHSLGGQPRDRQVPSGNRTRRSGMRQGLPGPVHPHHRAVVV